MPFRDFLYLDSALVQSIIAQLDKGLVTEFLAGKQIGGEVGLGLNLLRAILPSVSGKAGAVGHWSQTKVLDDYAFEVAIEKLKDAKLLGTAPASRLDASRLGKFVLFQGKPRIYDYAMFRRLLREEVFADLFEGQLTQSQPTPYRTTRQQRRQAERERLKQLHRLSTAAPSTSRQQPQGIADVMKALLDVFYGDMVVVRLTADELTVEGPLRREFLREDIITLTYKYGSEPQGTWQLLGLVTKVPEKQEGLDDLLEGLDEESRQAATIAPGGFGALSDAFHVVLHLMGNLQMAVGTVTYPNVGITPIALYREIGS